MGYTRSDIVKSKYLSAADLAGKAVTVTIESAPKEMLKSPDGKEQEKIVLSFVRAQKMLPLNLTNLDSCFELCGGNTDDWVGQRIEIYPTKTQMGGKMVDCLRIRAPEQKGLGLAKHVPKPAPKPELPPTLAEEIDDTIPF